MTDNANTDSTTFHGLRKFIRCFVIFLAIFTIIAAGILTYVFTRHADPAELFIFSPERFPEMKAPPVVIFLRNAITGRGIPRQKVNVEFNNYNKRFYAITTVTTDDDGFALIPPRNSQPEFAKISASYHKTRAYVNVSFTNTEKCVITTDKHSYLKGQTADIKVVSVNEITQRPDNTPIWFNIYDSCLREVLSQNIPSSKYGIESIKLPLTNKFIYDYYKIRLLVRENSRTANERSTTEIIIKNNPIGKPGSNVIPPARPYKPPSFTACSPSRLTIKTSRKTYKTGDKIKVEINGDKVTSKVFLMLKKHRCTFDFQKLSSKNNHAETVVKLPNNIAGNFLLQAFIIKPEGGILNTALPLTITPDNPADIHITSRQSNDNIQVHLKLRDRDKQPVQAGIAVTVIGNEKYKMTKKKPVTLQEFFDTRTIPSPPTTGYGNSYYSREDRNIDRKERYGTIMTQILMPICIIAILILAIPFAVIFSFMSLKEKDIVKLNGHDLALCKGKLATINICIAFLIMALYSTAPFNFVSKILKKDVLYSIPILLQYSLIIIMILFLVYIRKYIKKIKLIIPVNTHSSIAIWTLSQIPVFYLFALLMTYILHCGFSFFKHTGLAVHTIYLIVLISLIPLLAAIRLRRFFVNKAKKSPQTTNIQNQGIGINRSSCKTAWILTAIFFAIPLMLTITIYFASPYIIIYSLTRCGGGLGYSRYNQVPWWTPPESGKQSLFTFPEGMVSYGTIDRNWRYISPVVKYTNSLPNPVYHNYNLKTDIQGNASFSFKAAPGTEQRVVVDAITASGQPISTYYITKATTPNKTE